MRAIMQLELARRKYGRIARMPSLDGMDNRIRITEKRFNENEKAAARVDK